MVANYGLPQPCEQSISCTRLSLLSSAAQNIVVYSFQRPLLKCMLMFWYNLICWYYIILYVGLMCWYYIIILYNTNCLSSRDAAQNILHKSLVVLPVEYQTGLL